MAVTPLNWAFTIGGLTLTRFEVPQEFELGVQGHVAVHRYINEAGVSAVAVHGLGSFPMPTTWQGHLFGGTALNRHAQLQNLAANQIVTELAYGPLLYDVMVTHYAGKIYNQIKIAYTIELVIVKERNGTLAQLSPPTVPFDIGTQTVFDNASTAYNNLVTADVNLPASLSSLYNNLLTSIQNAYPLKGAALQVIQSILSTLQALISSVSAYALPLENNAIVEADLVKLDNALQMLAAMFVLQINLQQLVGASSSSPSTSLQFGNLYALAAKYFPNLDVPTTAAIIAQANNAYDYFIRVPTVLKIPPVLS